MAKDDYSKQSDLRQYAMLSPAEQEREYAFEQSPGNRAEFEQAIASEKNPASKAILLEQYAKDFGGARAPVVAQAAPQGGLSAYLDSLDPPKPSKRASLSDYLDFLDNQSAQPQEKKPGAFERAAAVYNDPEGGVVPALGSLVASALPSGGKRDGVGGFLKDTALDAAQGVVGLGESAIGLGDIATMGMLGKGLAALGYEPKQTSEFLSGLQTDERQQSNREVQDTKGFFPTLAALGTHPSVLIGDIVQSLPGTIGAGAAAGLLVKRLAATAAVEAKALGYTGDVATKFIADKVKEQAFKIAATASGAEGAQTAGSTAEAGRQAGKDWTQYVGPAIAAGLGTTAIGMVSGKVGQKLGIGDMETDIAARSAGVKGAGIGVGGLASRAEKEVAKESLLEEMPQSYQEKIMENLATGRPWDEGSTEAAARGGLAGFGMAASHAVISGRQPEEKPKLADPIAEIGSSSSVDEAITKAADILAGTNPQPTTLGTQTNVTAGPGFDVGSLNAPTTQGILSAGQQANDQADLDSLIASETRDLQVIDANRAQERQKQAELDQIQSTGTGQYGIAPEARPAVEQAATVEAPTAMQLALEKARLKAMRPTIPEVPAVPSGSPENTGVSPEIVRSSTGNSPVLTPEQQSATPHPNAQPGDITRNNGIPYQTENGARLRLSEVVKKGGSGEVVQIGEGAFVVRPKEANAKTPETVQVQPQQQTPAPDAIANRIDAPAEIQPAASGAVEPADSTEQPNGTLVERTIEPTSGRLSQLAPESPKSVDNRLIPKSKREDLGHLGRDSVPLTEGGKPFKTNKAAKEAKKNQPTMRVIRVEGGFALAPKTEAQIAAEARNARRLAVPRFGNPGVPLAAHEFVASRGGLRPNERSDMGIQGNVRVGNRFLFAGTTGMDMDSITEALKEAGYLRDSATHDDARNLIKRSLNNPQYTPEGTEKMAEREIEAQRAAFEAEQEAIAAAQEAEDNELDMAVAAFERAMDEIPKGLAQSDMSMEDALLVAGYTQQEIDDERSQNERAEADQSPAEAAPGESAQGNRGREGAQSQDSPAGSEEGLTVEDRIADLEYEANKFFKNGTEHLGRDFAAEYSALKSKFDGGAAQDQYAKELSELMAEHAEARNAYFAPNAKVNAEHAAMLASLKYDPASPQEEAFAKNRDQAISDLSDEKLKQLGQILGLRQSKNQSREAFVERITEQAGTDVRDAYLKVSEPDAAGLTSPTRADVLANQDRADNAQALDDKAQIDREAAGQTLTQQTEPDRRKDTTGDVFGGLNADDIEDIKNRLSNAREELRKVEDAMALAAPRISRDDIEALTKHPAVPKSLKEKRETLRKQIRELASSIGEKPPKPNLQPSGPSLFDQPAEAPSETNATLARTRRSSITFSTPYVGKTGAKLVGYEWANKKIEYVDQRGEDRVKRISDWDAADINEVTGRDIVHKFVIVNADGTESLMSAETAAVALGISESSVRSNAKSLLEAEIAKQKKEALAQKNLDDAENGEWFPTPAKAVEGLKEPLRKIWMRRAEWGKAESDYPGRDKLAPFLNGPKGWQAVATDDLPADGMAEKGLSHVTLMAKEVWDKNGNDATQQEPAAQATEILNAANITGKERIDALKDVKSGTITPDELKEAYPAKEEAKPLVAKEPEPSYSGAYETDLFGNPIPTTTGGVAPGRSKSAGVRGDVQPESSVSDTPAPSGDYYVNTLIASETKRELGASLIRTPVHAAQATQYLYKSAVERFDGIVTDKNGKPLAVVGGFKGAISQASVYPGTIMAEAIRIPGAANIWFSHNHPSGKSMLSAADKRLNETMTDVFRGSGIEPMGLLAVAGNDYSYVDANGSISNDPIPAAVARKSVPVMERQLADSSQAREVFSDPASARQAGRALYAKAKEPGIMLMDAQMGLAAWIPITKTMMGPLRGTGGAAAVYRAVSQSNASNAIIIHGGELDYAGIGNYQKFTPSENIAAALRKVDVSPLDSINVVTGKSSAEQGRPIADGPMFSRQAMDTYAKHSIDPEKVSVGDWKGRVIFHGTSDAGADSIHRDGVVIDKSSGGYFGVGFYAATDANLAADNYAEFAEGNGESGAGSVIAIKIKNTAKILDLRDEKDWEAYQATNPDNHLSKRDFAERMTKAGIDGLFDRSFGGLVIYNPKAIEILPDAPAKFSRADNKAPKPQNQPTGTTVANLKTAIKAVTGIDGFNKLGRIVATTAADIKSTWEPLIGYGVNLESQESAGKAQAFYDPKSKTVFLIADNIREGDEAAVLAHELIHKWGKTVLGEEGWNRLHDVINSWKDAPTNSDERTVYDYARRHVEAVGMELSSEEMFPYAVEAAIKMGIKPSMAAKKGTVARWLESVKQNLAQVWAKVTGKPETFKAQDLVNLAFGIAQMENPEMAGVVNFRDTNEPMTNKDVVGNQGGNVAVISKLNRVMRNAGWEIEYIDIDLTAEKPKAAIRINRDDGRYLIAKVDSIGRANFETFQRERSLGMDASTKGRRPLTPLVEDTFLGRQRFEGARSMLRGMTNYLTDNASNPIALADIRSAWAGVMNAPVKQEGMPLIPNEPTAPDSGGAQTDTPAFKAWFGDSKVVDADGKPMVVYHGTASDISEFRRTRTGEFGPAIYTTTDSGEAAEYGVGAGAHHLSQAPVNVMPVYVSLQNPFTLGVTVFWNRYNKGDGDAAAVQRAMDDGFDGVIEGRIDWRGKQSFTHYIAFKPEQIKSAIGNRGTFDAANPDIRFSRSTIVGQTLQDAGSLNNPRGLVNAAVEHLNDRFNAPGTLNWWQKSIGTQYDLAQRSKPFKKVFDSVQNFINDTSYYATEAADLAPKLVPKLESWKDIVKKPISSADSKAIATPIFEGTLIWGRDENGKLTKVTGDQPAGVVFTNQELKTQFGLTPEQIELYREFRTATDKSLTNLVVSHMVKLGGTDVAPIADMALQAKNATEAGEMLSNYLVSLAENDEARSDVLMSTAAKVTELADKANDLTGKGYAPLSRFGHYTVDVISDGQRVYFGMFESKIEANQMAKRMQENYPKSSIRQGTVSEEEYKLFAGVTPETLELFGEMLGLDSQGSDAKNQVFQEYLKAAKSNRSAMKRLIHRKGIAGFSEDASRVLAGFIYSNARQTSANLHAGEITKATSEIPQGQGEVKDAAIKLATYVQNPQEEAQALRGLMFAQYIGGSVASAMVNLTQPFTMTLPWLSQYGGIAKAGKQMAAATRDALKDKTGDAKLDAALKHAEEEGIVSPQEVHQLQQQASGAGSLKSGDGTKLGDAKALASNSVSRVMLGWGKLFGVAEQFNRRSTFIAAYRTAVEQGMDNPAQFAERAIAETQGIYNKGNKPAWARGAVGSTIFTFKQFSVAYLEMIGRMVNGPEANTASRMAALNALAILVLVAGVGGLPGADDLDDLISGILQSMGYNFDSKAKRRAFLMEHLGAGGQRFVEHGLSGLPGVPIDVSGRLGLGNLIPGTGLFTKKKDHTSDVAELAGPAGDLFRRGFQAGGALVKGDVGEAVNSVAPMAARNVVKAFDMANMGMYRDQRGNKVIDTDIVDAVFKGIGFQPAEVKQVQDATGEIQRMVGLNKMRESEIADKWAQGLFEKNPEKAAEARQELLDWNAANPDMRIKIDYSQIFKRLKAMNQTKAQRIEKTAPKEIRAAVRQELMTQ